MALSLMKIRVEPGGELDRLLDKAGTSSIELERNGIRYRLTRIDADSDIWAGYDPETAITGMREAAGTWGDLDVDALKDYLYRARGVGSRPVDRP